MHRPGMGDTGRMPRRRMRTRIPAAAAALFACILLAACDADEPPALAVRDVEARILPQGGMGAVYLVIENRGGADVLTGVETDPPVLASLHESVHEDGIARMLARDEVAVPAHGRLDLKPGGLHVMLSRVPVPPPSEIGLVLHFRRHADIMVAVPLAGGRGSGLHPDHHDSAAAH
ncbi:MAG: hypothetical protein KatS3mg119_2367 [Rhodothalassiaceae bacterium]|nr:MAG: hypothetical protein KatS3mg119_2367 [Rhodothalassiaceae bacterium]